MVTRKAILLTILSLCLLQAPGVAQLRVRPVAEDGGTVELALLLRKLQAGPTFMMTTAHPDDENNALLAQLDWGLGLRTTLVTATRGQGGQNEIGPELFDALAVLRTEELRSAHRFDGAEQFFTRAIDPGYSFSIEENLELWGKEEILGDFVRHIRTIRPDVIVGFIWGGEGGGQAHQASSRLTAEAFRAAADPSRYPEQITGGLRPWQAKKFYYTAGFGRLPELPPGTLVVDGSAYDPLLGRTYAEIGSEARSMHKCQGMSQLLALPGELRLAYTLHDTVLPGHEAATEHSVMDGVPIGLTEYLMQLAGDSASLRQRLQAIAGHVQRASDALTSRGLEAAVGPLAEGLAALRSLRGDLGGVVAHESARYEIDFRLTQKEELFEQALGTAAAIRVEALADDGLVIGGQPVTVNLLAANQGKAAVTVSSVRLEGFDGAAGCQPRTIDAGSTFECESEVRIPRSAEPTGIYFTRAEGDVARYEFDEDVPFGVPFAPTPYRARIALRVGEADISLTKPVQFRYQTDVFAGEKRTELLVVPAMAVRIDPGILIVPTGGSGARRPENSGREVRVTVINHRTGAARGQVSLTVPQGWTSEPAAAPVQFTREDEAATVRFSVRPDANVEPGRFDITAVVVADDVRFDRGYQVVEYPHTQRRHVTEPAKATATAIDVTVPQNLTVGYVVGVGDAIPQALTQLGLRVEFVDSDTLAWGDLSKYDVIMTGVRAYERRADLRANNQRLLEYARQGGVVIVNYNKFEFNEAQYGPYPVRVGRGRVTDETSAVRVLAPDHPVFTTPNRIGPDTWEGWVQERGLYFLGPEGRAPEYTDLVELEDPFPYNPGVQRGALVEAQVGKGRWIYLGLGLWRQLPAGTPGAYKLMANLIALGAR